MCGLLLVLEIDVTFTTSGRSISHMCVCAGSNGDFSGAGDPIYCSFDHSVSGDRIVRSMQPRAYAIARVFV